MVEVKFKVVHRVLLESVLNKAGETGHFPLSKLGQIIKIQEIVAFNDEERTAFNFRMEGDGDTKRLLWNSRQENMPEGETLDIEKPFSFSNEQKDLICDIIKKRSDANEFSITEANPVIEIATQLGMDL